MPRHFLHRSKKTFQIDGVDLVDHLYYGKHPKGEKHWYSTPSGGARMGRPGDDGIVTLLRDSRYQLSNADDVTAYLKEAKNGSDEDDLAIVALAFYPGFFKAGERNERRMLPIDTLCDYMKMPIILRNLKRYACRSGVGRHTLHNIPKAYVAKLGAHATFTDNPFSKLPESSLFHESLFEGWKYQLANPNEPYRQLAVHTVRNKTNRVTVVPTSTELLAATKLTEADFVTAENIAISLHTGSPEKIRRTILELLAELTLKRTGKRKSVEVDLKAVDDIAPDNLWSF